MTQTGQPPTSPPSTPGAAAPDTPAPETPTQAASTQAASTQAASTSRDGRGRLAGRVAVITGAGSGIGRATALRFAAEGARLLLADIDAARVTATTALAREAGADAAALAGDVGDPAHVRDLIATAVDRFGRVDVLHNNAAFSIPGRIGDVSDEDWRTQQRVVLDSVFHGIRAVLPHMIARGGGSIVNTASGAGINGEHGLGAYAAHKAAVINLTRTVAMEYAEDGVRCNAITPGPTATEPLLAWLDTVPGGAERFTDTAMLRRLSTPEEVAEMVLWLASDESSVVSGVVLQANSRVSSSRPPRRTP